MATAAQIAANRRNALASTGPRTAEGKGASNINAIKSGIYAKSLIIRGEDPAELEALRDDFYNTHQPQFADERALVDALVANEWTLRRLRKSAAQLWESTFVLMEPLGEQDGPTALAGAFADAEMTFLSLQRVTAAAERAFHRALFDLERLKKSRSLPQPVATEGHSAELASFPHSTIRARPCTLAARAEAAIPAPDPALAPEIGFVPADPASAPLDTPPPDPDRRHEIGTAA